MQQRRIFTIASRLAMLVVATLVLSGAGCDEEESITYVGTWSGFDTDGDLFYMVLTNDRMHVIEGVDGLPGFGQQCEGDLGLVHVDDEGGGVFRVESSDATHMTFTVSDEALALTGDVDNDVPAAWTRYYEAVDDVCVSGNECEVSTSSAPGQCVHQLSCDVGTHTGFDCTEDGDGTTCSCSDLTGNDSTCVQTTLDCSLGWQASCCELSFIP